MHAGTEPQAAGAPAPAPAVERLPTVRIVAPLGTEGNVHELLPQGVRDALTDLAARGAPLRLRAHAGPPLRVDPAGNFRVLGPYGALESGAQLGGAELPLRYEIAPPEGLWYETPPSVFAVGTRGEIALPRYLRGAPPGARLAELILGGERRGLPLTHAEGGILLEARADGTLHTEGSRPAQLVLGAAFELGCGQRWVAQLRVAHYAPAERRVAAAGPLTLTGDPDRPWAPALLAAGPPGGPLQCGERGVATPAAGVTPLPTGARVRWAGPDPRAPARAAVVLLPPDPARPPAAWEVEIHPPRELAEPELYPGQRRELGWAELLGVPEPATTGMSARLELHCPAGILAADDLGAVITASPGPPPGTEWETAHLSPADGVCLALRPRTLPLPNWGPPSRLLLPGELAVLPLPPGCAPLSLRADPPLRAELTRGALIFSRGAAEGPAPPPEAAPRLRLEYRFCGETRELELAVHAPPALEPERRRHPLHRPVPLEPGAYCGGVPLEAACRWPELRWLAPLPGGLRALSPGSVELRWADGRAAALEFGEPPPAAPPAGACRGAPRARDAPPDFGVQAVVLGVTYLEGPLHGIPPGTNTGALTLVVEGGARRLEGPPGAYVLHLEGGAPPIYAVPLLSEVTAFAPAAGGGGPVLLPPGPAAADAPVPARTTCSGGAAILSAPAAELRGPELELAPGGSWEAAGGALLLTGSFGGSAAELRAPECAATHLGARVTHWSAESATVRRGVRRTSGGTRTDADGGAFAITGAAGSVLSPALSFSGGARLLGGSARPLPGGGLRLSGGTLQLESAELELSAHGGAEYRGGAPDFGGATAPQSAPFPPSASAAGIPTAAGGAALVQGTDGGDPAEILELQGAGIPTPAGDLPLAWASPPAPWRYATILLSAAGTQRYTPAAGGPPAALEGGPCAAHRLRAAPLPPAELALGADGAPGALLYEHPPGAAACLPPRGAAELRFWEEPAPGGLLRQRCALLRPPALRDALGSGAHQISLRGRGAALWGGLSTEGGTALSWEYRALPPLALPVGPGARIPLLGAAGDTAALADPQGNPLPLAIEGSPPALWAFLGDAPPGGYCLWYRGTAEGRETLLGLPLELRALRDYAELRGRAGEVAALELPRWVPAGEYGAPGASANVAGGRCSVALRLPGSYSLQLGPEFLLLLHAAPPLQSWECEATAEPGAPYAIPLPFGPALPLALATDPPGAPAAWELDPADPALLLLRTEAPRAELRATTPERELLLRCALTRAPGPLATLRARRGELALPPAIGGFHGEPLALLWVDGAPLIPFSPAAAERGAPLPPRLLAPRAYAAERRAARGILAAHPALDPRLPVRRSAEGPGLQVPEALVQAFDASEGVLHYQVYADGAVEIRAGALSADGGRLRTYSGSLRFLLGDATAHVPLGETLSVLTPAGPAAIGPPAYAPAAGLGVLIHPREEPEWAPFAAFDPPVHAAPEPPQLSLRGRYDFQRRAYSAPPTAQGADAFWLTCYEDPWNVWRRAHLLYFGDPAPAPDTPAPPGATIPLPGGPLLDLWEIAPGLARVPLRSGEVTPAAGGSLRLLPPATVEVLHLPPGAVLAWATPGARGKLRAPPA